MRLKVSITVNKEEIMTDQDRFVFVIHAAVGVVQSAMNGLEDIWTTQHTECQHFREKAEFNCTMNGPGVAKCTFKDCPYTTL